MTDKPHLSLGAPEVVDLRRKTYVFLDVDGVINAWPPSSKPRWEWDDRVGRTRAAGFLIVYSPAFVAALNALAARDDVEVCWLTTWTQHAPDDLCPALGIDGADWPVIGAAEYEVSATRDGWWKLAAVRGFLDEHEGARFVWIDDDLRYESAARALCDYLGHDRALAVAPLSHRGLTRGEFDRIEAWIDKGAP